MQTELDFPPREKPARHGFPSRTGGVRRWLNEISALDGRETTRRFCAGIHALNRMEIPARRRARIMEMMRPTAREVLDHVGLPPSRTGRRRAGGANGRDGVPGDRLRLVPRQQSAAAGKQLGLELIAEVKAQHETGDEREV
ncbi:MAG: hypothetical protein GVY29_05835 [Spirochaetes bacterium]|jgi:hypothetical protein|nr:hypothetical protein [Spirochaetota bacterium]